MKKKKTLTPREKLFCVYYAHSGDAKKSAIYAGYKKNHRQKADRLLVKKEIQNEIADVSKTLFADINQIVKTGYHRLAFSDISDAIRLLYMDSVSAETLSSMDLFMVQEIKKPKDGAMEIKFFDRLKALESLSKSCGTKEESSGLFDAFNIAAKNISEECGDINGV